MPDLILTETKEEYGIRLCEISNLFAPRLRVTNMSHVGHFTCNENRKSGKLLMSRKVG